MTKRRLVPTESQEQATVVQFWASYCHTKGLDARLLFSIPNGAHLAGDAKHRAIQMNRLKREGLRTGVPDLMLAFPKIRRTLQFIFTGLFIEMKRKGEKARPDQIAYADLLWKQGYNCVICRSADEAIRAIRGYIES